MNLNTKSKQIWFYLILFCASGTVLFISGCQNQTDKKQKIPEDVSRYLTVQPNDVEILFVESDIDRQNANKALSLILKSKQKLVFKNTKNLPVPSTTVLAVLKTHINTDMLGAALTDRANSYRWNVTTVETSKGYFSNWMIIYSN